MKIRVVLALAAVYLIWGSTYLAISVAIETLPALLMTGFRFVVAGAVLYLWASAREHTRVTGRQWAGSAVVGTLLFIVGNGGVVIAVRSVPTGLASVVVATMPGWAVLFAFRRSRPTRRQLAGLLLGFTGVAALGLGGQLGGEPVDIAALFIAPVGWALGSVLAARLGLPSGYMGAATTMLTGGGVLMLSGLALGEGVGPVSQASALALVYLVVFGSLLGFSAYRYLLESVTPAVATSYAFVNPVVALALGAALAGERLTPGAAGAGALALVGVILVVAPDRRERASPPGGRLPV